MSITLQTIRKHGLRPKKRFGQHFMINDSILYQMIELAKITTKDHVVEIGSGIGNLTRIIAEKSAHVTAFEIEQTVYDISKTELLDFNNITLVYERGEYFPNYIKSVKSVKIISNLPYDSYSQVILSMAEVSDKIECAVLMMQKEAFSKLVSVPGDRFYGPMSVICSRFFTINMIRMVPKRWFYPMPKVESVLAFIKPKIQKFKIMSVIDCLKTLKLLFSYRKKRLSFYLNKNSIKYNVQNEALLNTKICLIDSSILFELSSKC